MATVGLSRPYCAVYTDNGNDTVTYSEGMVIAKAIEHHLTLNTNGENILRADNSIAESAKEFSGGELSLITDRLPLAAAELLFGLTVEDITIGGGTEAVGTRVVFDDDQTAPYLGYGIIRKDIEDGVPKYTAIILPKIQFSNPPDDAVTQGETISWQTPTLTATVMRDDTAKHTWREWATFATEANAEAYIRQALNIASSVEP